MNELREEKKVRLKSEERVFGKSQWETIVDYGWAIHGWARLKSEGTHWIGSTNGRGREP